MLFQSYCVAHSIKLKLDLNSYADLYQDLIPVNDKSFRSWTIKDKANDLSKSKVLVIKISWSCFNQIKF